MWLGPWMWDTHTNKLESSQSESRARAHTHTHLPGHTTEITSSTGPSFQSQLPAAHTVALSLQRVQGGEWEALSGRRPLFSI